MIRLQIKNLENWRLYSEDATGLIVLFKMVEF